LKEITVAKRNRLTVGKIEEVLRAAGGLKTVAAHKLNIHRATLYRWLAKHPGLLDVVAEIEEEICDIAEAKVIQAIRSGDMQTVRWFLETKGKGRGYVRRVEATGADGGPIEARTTVDLSACSDAELEAMRVLAAAREARENGDRDIPAAVRPVHWPGSEGCACGVCQQRSERKAAA
jgi:hypothetical protein